uniref:Purple acid phosphatase n=1 Tax=Bursaphelenchus xylophilus TaxID=6326 RepID=A0A1I7S6A4_BURXY
MIERQVLHLLPFALLFCININEVFMTKTFLQKDRTPDWVVANNPNMGPKNAQPEQVHLAMHGPDKYIVTWATHSDPGHSYVTYGVDGRIDDNRVEAQSTYFHEKGGILDVLYVHHATIEGIKPGVVYTYRVGSDYGFSHILRFKGLEERPDGGYKVAVYGDFGYENARSIAPLTNLAQTGGIDLVMHVGDMAYNLDIRGDPFMRMIEPIASTVPYMVSPGNHEMEMIPYHNYIYRYNMPNSYDNHYYSYDLGKAHIISFSTEFYYDFYSGIVKGLVQQQYEWLENDLQKANANRKNVPWIITLGHRPMYCSTDDGDDCRNKEARVRVGWKSHYGLEALFYKYGVDLEVWAHEHTYERLYPTYDRQVYDGAESPYVDPPAPVHIISGSAGCNENTDQFVKNPEPWSAFRSTNYGFSLMQVHNDTHLHWQQVKAADKSIEDDLWIIKRKHAPYSKRDLLKLKRNSRFVPYGKAERWHEYDLKQVNKTPKRSTDL